MKRTHVALAAMFLAGGVTAADAQDNAAIQKAAEEKAVNLCSTCHGPRGISTSPEFPILAAQRKGYLEAQINAFRAKTRSEQDAHDFMWGIAGNLDEAIIGAIAQYYASQPPAPGRTSDPALVAKGKEFFDKGSPSGEFRPARSATAPTRWARRTFRAWPASMPSTWSSNSITSSRWFGPLP